MFGIRKKTRVINSLFSMYKIFHDAISFAHKEGVYTGKEYNKIHEKYSSNMLSVARAVSGEEGVFQLSMLCSQFHDENVKKLDKELEEIKERDAEKREEEKVSGVEEKYDGCVTTVTKSPVYSNRWQPTLIGQPWQPAIGEADWHAREGEMGSRGQEKTGAEFVIGGGRGVEGGPLRGANEKPAVTYIYHLKITHQKETLEIAWERDKLFDILKNMGFEVSKVDWKTICIHTTNNSSGFVKIVNSACERSGVGADYEAVYKGKMVPVVRYEDEV